MEFAITVATHAIVLHRHHVRLALQMTLELYQQVQLALATVDIMITLFKFVLLVISAV